MRAFSKKLRKYVKESLIISTMTLIAVGVFKPTYLAKLSVALNENVFLPGLKKTFDQIDGYLENKTLEELANNVVLCSKDTLVIGSKQIVFITNFYNKSGENGDGAGDVLGYTSSRHKNNTVINLKSFYFDKISLTQKQKIEDIILTTRIHEGAHVYYRNQKKTIESVKDEKIAYLLAMLVGDLEEGYGFIISKANSKKKGPDVTACKEIYDFLHNNSNERITYQEAIQRGRDLLEKDYFISKDVKLGFKEEIKLTYDFVKILTNDF